MSFPSIRIEGAILSGELLSRLDSSDFRGQKAADFGFDSPSRLKEEIVRAWTDAHAFWKAFQRRIETLKDGTSGLESTGTRLGAQESKGLALQMVLLPSGYFTCSGLELSKGKSEAREAASTPGRASPRCACRCWSCTAAKTS